MGDDLSSSVSSGGQQQQQQRVLNLLAGAYLVPADFQKIWSVQPDVLNRY
jgi:hypothetical protein